MVAGCITSSYILCHIIIPLPLNGGTHQSETKKKMSGGGEDDTREDDPRQEDTREEDSREDDTREHDTREDHTREDDPTFNACPLPAFKQNFVWLCDRQRERDRKRQRQGQRQGQRQRQRQRERGERERERDLARSTGVILSTMRACSLFGPWSSISVPRFSFMLCESTRLRFRG